MKPNSSRIWATAALTVALACQSVEPGGATTDNAPPDGSSEDSAAGPPATEGFTDSLDPPLPNDFGPGAAYQCDPWKQDCPEGQKCTQYSLDGGKTLDAAKCVPLPDPAQQVGDLCMAEGGYGAGINDCDEGLQCEFVAPTGAGFCFQICDGASAFPQCPAGQLCAKGFGDYHYKCLTTCDPLEQNCIEGMMCALSNDGFVCAGDVSGAGGQLYDDCNAANACDRGHFCGPPDVAPGCDPNAPGCCLLFCEVGGVCPEGLQCFALFEQDDYPEYADIGGCYAPP